MRQFVLGSTCRKIRRFNGFAAAPLRGNSTKIGGKRIETDTTQWQSRKNGTYNPKHNDRRFDVEHSEHINPEMTKKNVYWDCYTGIKSVKFRNPGEEDFSFEEIENFTMSSIMVIMWMLKMHETKGKAH